jgi:hypothetical protein
MPTNPDKFQTLPIFGKFNVIFYLKKRYNKHLISIKLTFNHYIVQMKKFWRKIY